MSLELSSAFLRRALADRDESFEAGDGELIEAMNLLRRLAQELVNSRRALTDVEFGELDGFLSDEDGAAWHLNDFYCRESLEHIPRIVRRTLELSSLAIPTAMRPKGSVHVFYEQAVRCYVFGLWQAASVLARGTVETALREQVSGHRLDGLGELIDRAVRQRTLTGHAIEAACIVKAVGDPAVHGDPITEQSAKRLVICAKEVVVHLFQGRMGDESRP